MKQNIKGVCLIPAWAFYFLFASFLAIRFDLGYIVFMLLYFAVPSAYFSFMNPTAILKDLFYALAFSVPTTVLIALPVVAVALMKMH